MKYELTGDGQTIHRTVHRSEPRKHLEFIPGHLVVNVKADAFLPFLDEARATRSLKAFPEKLAAPLRHLQTPHGALYCGHGLLNVRKLLRKKAKRHA